MKTTREFTQTEILESKGYKKGFSEYHAPGKFFEGLLNIEEEKFNISVNGSHEDISINEDKTENLVFKRFNLMYTFTIDEELQYNLGLVVALDMGKPIAKIYSGVQVKACLNMCIFSSDQVIKFDLSSNPTGYKAHFIEQFKRISERVERSKVIINELKKIQLTQFKIDELNGAILRNLIATNGTAGTNPIINGIKLQSRNDSKYFTKNGLSAWLYYNSLTEYVEEKIHVLDIAEKALNIFEVLKDNLKFSEEPLFLENQKIIEEEKIEIPKIFEMPKREKVKNTIIEV